MKLCQCIVYGRKQGVSDTMHIVNGARDLLGMGRASFLHVAQHLFSCR